MQLVKFKVCTPAFNSVCHRNISRIHLIAVSLVLDIGCHGLAFADDVVNNDQGMYYLLLFIKYFIPALLTK